MIKNRFFIFLFSITLMRIMTINAQEESFIISPEKLNLVKQAWSINTSGDTIPSYYSITINNHKFNGIRPFEVRWNMIKNALDYKNKKILELGCCTALVSTLLERYRKPSQVVAVDKSSQRLHAAQLFAQAFDVNVEFYKLNLDQDNYEKILGDNFDIVFCMSLLHWVSDKNRLMNYLSKFNTVIFEGHESNQTEINRFKKAGFTEHKILGPSDRGRTLILFTK